MKRSDIASILNEDLLTTNRGKAILFGIIVVLMLGLSFAGSIDQSDDAVSRVSEDKTEETASRDVPVEDRLPEKGDNTTEVAPAELYPVERVVDGDTIVVQVNGVSERVRLIGIDTPETVHPQNPVECFGVEASNKAKSLLEGENVGLERDYSQDDRDIYGRLLRYAILEDGTNFNKLMIEDGYAFEYTFRAPYEYQSEFRRAERDAREAGRGLWAADTCGGESTAAQTQEPATSRYGEGGECNIKGNISYNTGNKIYHVPGGEWYSQTVINESQGERWFCSEQEAQNVGWRRSSR